MKCFERLVECEFLANIRSELELARDTVVQEKQTIAGFKIYGVDRRTRKAGYDLCVKQYDLLQGIRESVGDNPDLLFYVQLDHLIFAFSKKKAQIDDAIRHSYNLNGDLPFYRGKHRVNGITFHTVLIDTRFSFIPMSPN